ncbi:hypothetical protein [Cerasicoccus arenae]|uniref:Uncharacterized protein n=1 Tax=Cerasicoccus arenae TaxID=424488 RepID=A0A8J3DHB7_9BACT|nr:hypothetical protein [Cerasicoccus arenae]MBK1858250.1 hypothetical protein [Cerasicoccus arenae]GHC02164.1 hypothetical protein GCM10007047_18360 [Cerasicoccus arenae]
MPRELDSAFLAALESTGGAALRPVLFVRLNIESLSGDSLVADPILLWNGYGDFTPATASDAAFDGETFLGNGWLQSIGEIEETLAVEVSEVSLAFTGLADDLVTALMTKRYKNRPAYVWLGLLNDVGELAAPPARIFTGRMDTFSLPDSPSESSIELTLVGHLVDPQRPKAVRYTHTEQQRLFPGDLGLIYVTNVQDKEEFWGKADPEV